MTFHTIDQAGVLFGKPLPARWKGQDHMAPRADADVVTTPNGGEGFANAVAQFIFPRRPALPVAS